ncbi:hypothetical protein EV193_113134 [Herbihabitans rhizosphaerae]|uniref:Uncharacterized protein n=1 Tax=Herbihabitans rhizosphaerae TaxID=1872711 RepID=A0A4Q7KED1_9PSEU|nr:hypothetical protein [Herbihabitans rhizosphaerae]RZS32290.1 hypothetical protein EV193_113134 [Herbihabitans rhizosphaerae]
MDVWEHDGDKYEYESYYSVPDEAWRHELMPLDGAPETYPWMHVVVPDTVDDGPFTPAPPERVTVAVGGDGELPWPVVRRFLEEVYDSGHVPR